MLGRDQTPGQWEETAVETEELTLNSAAIQLPAAAFWPPGAGPHPGVVVATGGLETGSIDAYRWAGERLATGGYAALVATYSAPSPYSDVDDLSLALDWLASSPRIDGKRLAIWGHSRGGLGALLAAARDDRLRAVVSICAPSDLPDYMNRLGTYFPAARDSIAKFLGGLPDEVSEKYQAINLLSLSGRLKKPLLLIHGTADMRVPVDQSIRLAESLKEGGNENLRLELMPGVGHFLELGTLGYQFDRVIDMTVSWLNEVIP
jgi:dipeptidyl aminopeptidase/acylaminoacyl peptidase